jgi:hypothetical protein
MMLNHLDKTNDRQNSSLLVGSFESEQSPPNPRLVHRLNLKKQTIMPDNK